MIKYYIVGIIIGFIPGFLLSEIICKSKKEDDVKAIFVGCMQKNEEMICNWHIDDIKSLPMLVDGKWNPKCPEDSVVGYDDNLGIAVCFFSERKRI